MTTITSAERRAYQTATERDNNQCVKCHREGVHRDHRKNRSQRGKTTPANLQLMCVTCHKWATEHPADAVAEGWGVPGWADPLTYPARRWLPTGIGTVRLAWVLYRDDGRWVEIADEEAERRIREGRMYEEEVA